MSGHAPPRRGSLDRVKATEATDLNVISPKGISRKAPKEGDEHAAAEPSKVDIRKARKRLSVVSDNTLVEGISSVQLDDSNDSKVFEGKSNCVKTYAGVSKKGYAPYNPRKKNQDSMLMHEDPATGSIIYCVFDGHGEAGDLVSQFFRDKLPQALTAHAGWASTGVPENDIANIKKALRETVLSLEKTVLKDSSIDTEFSGSTGVLSVVRGDYIIVGNIGDSRIIAASVNNAGKIVPVTISVDHKPDRPDEKQRILQAGGRVFAVEYDDGVDGPPRVWLGHMDVPGLAMSRSLGDSIAHTAGVSSEPEFFVKKVDENDKYIILASDGLWEFMSNEEVTGIADNHKDPRAAVDALIVEANSRWMKEEQVIDDTTVILAQLSVTKSAGAPHPVAT